MMMIWRPRMRPQTSKNAVVKESFEDVELVMDLPRTDHVHDLHEHKQVEEECEVSGFSTREMQVVGIRAVNRLCNDVKVLRRHYFAVCQASSSLSHDCLLLMPCDE